MNDLDYDDYSYDYDDYDYYDYDPLDDCENLEKIYVPTSSVILYEFVNGWDRYAYLIEGYDFSN